MGGTINFFPLSPSAFYSPSTWTPHIVCSSIWDLLGLVVSYFLGYHKCLCCSCATEYWLTVGLPSSSSWPSLISHLLLSTTMAVQGLPLKDMGLMGLINRRIWAACKALVCGEYDVFLYTYLYLAIFDILFHHNRYVILPLICHNPILHRKFMRVVFTQP